MTGEIFSISFLNEYMADTSWGKLDVYRIIPVSLKRPITCAAIQQGGIEEWKFAWQKFQASNIQTEKKELLAGMTCSNQPPILSKSICFAYCSLFSEIIANLFHYYFVIYPFNINFKLALILTLTLI